MKPEVEMKSSRVFMAKALAGAAMLGALSLSVVASAAAEPAAGAARGLLPEQAPEISVGAGVSTMVTVPDGSRAYVADAGAPTITAYDLSTGSVVAVVQLPGQAVGLARSRDGARIYVSTSSVADGNYFVTVSTSTNTVASKAKLDDVAYTMAETSDGKAILALGQSSAKNLYSIDGTTGALDKTISIAQLDGSLEALSVSTSPGDPYAYISRAAMTSATASTSDVLVVDPGTQTIVRTLKLCGAVGAIAFSRDGATGYFGCGDGHLAVLPSSTGAVLKTIDVGFQVNYAQLTAGGTRLIVAGNMHRQLAEIDTATLQVVSTFTSTGSVYSLSAPQLGDRVWYLRGNEDRTVVLASLDIGTAGTVGKSPTPTAGTAVTTPAAEPTQQALPIVARTTAPAASPASAAGTEREGLAATGPARLVPIVAGALALLLLGGITLRFRKQA
jgi:hypothetical protein